MENVLIPVQQRWSQAGRAVHPRWLWVIAVTTTTFSLTGILIAFIFVTLSVNRALPLGGGGSYIAFTSSRSGAQKIFLLDTISGVTHELVEQYVSCADDDPSWSPSGREIVFVVTAMGGCNRGIYVVNADGSGLRQLVKANFSESETVWSPTGDQIAFVSHQTGNYDVYVMDADGTNVRNLTNDSAPDYSPAWSPDARQIVFATERDGNREIYVMDSDGGSVRRLTNNVAVDRSPVWSPDGRHIAFVTNRDDALNFEIYLMNADGGELRNLTHHPMIDDDPAWSADGSVLAFTSKRDGKGRLYVLDVDRNLVGLLTVPSIFSEDWRPAWQP